MNELLRQRALYSQGLATRYPFGAGVAATRCAIEHLGYIQIDTLSVVERAHHHVLWNRVEGYEQSHLNTLIRQKHIFEYWFHAASYLPVRDYRYVLAQMDTVRRGENRYFSHGDKHLMNEIMAQVKAEGEIRLRDIAKGSKAHSGEWWNLGPGRRSVEQLFMQGDLMVCARNGMQKSYALPEHCLPDDVDMSMPSIAEYALYLFNTTRRAHGVFSWKQLLHLKAGKDLRDAMREIVHAQIAAGSIIVFDYINHTKGQTLYVDATVLEQPPLVTPVIKILSPFDNLIIHRDRLSLLFGFEYRMECYVAASKRVFGYFCLPVLYGDRFIGRMDCKAHRATQAFEVISLHLEQGQLDWETLLPLLASELERFAVFNGCLLPQENAMAVLRRFI